MSSILQKWQYPNVLSKLNSLHIRAINTPRTIEKIQVHRTTHKRKICTTSKIQQITSTPIPELTEKFPHLQTHEEIHKFSIEKVKI